VERFEHWWRPLSAAVAVPLFALLSVGISVSGDSLSAALHDPAARGVLVGRLVGKTVGIFGGAYVLARLTAARLNPDLEWADVFGVAVLAGIGFAVPLLVSDVTFGAGTPRADRVTVGILATVLIAAGAGGLWLRLRHRHYERLYLDENRDDNNDGIPDVYQPPIGQTDPHSDR
jgi:NhaA family Na+:H+ antiporter